MRRYYVSPQDVRGNRIYIKGPEAHHIVHVMRLTVGDTVIIFDDTGNEYVATIEKKSRGDLVAMIKEMRCMKETKAFKITLAQALPKGNKMDYIIQKCTELGIETIIPLLTARTIITLDEKKKLSRQDRWRKIAREASKQCGRVALPQIGEPKRFEEVLTSVKDFDLSIIPCLEGKRKDLKSLLRGNKSDGVIVFIGPEGDFTTEEIRMAEKAGCIPVSLGPMILKSDTAAVVSIAILNYELRGA